jgi:hypothetical protein
MKMTFGTSAISLVLLSLAFSGCDNSSSNGGNGGNGGTGGDRGFRDNDGGNGAQDNTPVTPETNNLPPPQTMQCGEALCRDVLLGDIHLPPCCADAEREACGYDLAPIDYLPVQDGCKELRQPGTIDQDCPGMAFDDPVAPMDLPGCCMPSGQCGVVADILLVGNFGCVDPREFLTDVMNVPDDLPACVPVLVEDGGAPSGDPDPEDPDASITTSGDAG